MKVCIITVHDIVNCGSYWQAYALGKKCEELGADVYYLKRNIFKKIIYRIKNYIKYIYVMIFRNFSLGVNRFKTDFIFRKSQKKFKEVNFPIKDSLLIIGSDTLWNINDYYFKKNYKIYFGCKFNNFSKITYAISAANVNYNELIKIDNVSDYINNFDAISVRDKNTKEISKKIYKGNVIEVCDPTLLFCKSDYEKFVSFTDPKYKYVYLYLFDKLNENQIKCIKEFATKKGLKIVDGIGKNNWSDLTVSNTPNNFINHIYFSDYVITDTFHGTVFSTNFNKEFIVINQNKNKVNEFLKKYNLSNRLICNDNLNGIFKEKINYELINKILEKNRKESELFLAKYVKK